MLPFSFGYPQNYSSSPLPTYHSTMASNDVMFRASTSSVNSMLPSINTLILPPLRNTPSIPSPFRFVEQTAEIQINQPVATQQQKTVETPKNEPQDEEEENLAFLLTTLSQPTTITSSPKNSNSVESITTPTRSKRMSRSSSKSESEVEGQGHDSQESSEEDASDFDETFVEVAPKRRRVPVPASEPAAQSDSDSSLSPITPASPSSTLETPSTSPTTPKKASKKSNRAKYNDDLWFQHFEELKKFKKKHGHTNVTQSHKGSKTLANWVHNQRKNQGRNMPPNRRKLLEEIGFEFNRAYAAVTFNKKKKDSTGDVSLDTQQEASPITNL